MKTKPIIYMDACCFIDAVKQSVGNLPNERIDDVWHIKKLLEAHHAGEVLVITSFLSVAECVAVDSGQIAVPVEVQDQFRRLLTSGQYLALVQQTPKTGTIIQDMRWQQQIVLKGADALHIATALEHDAQEFISTDDRLRKPKIAEAAVKLKAKGIRFIRGSDSQLVPDRFRQGELGRS